MSELSCLPYGVGYADEGVCLSLQMGPYRLLLDCGLSDISPLQEQAADFVLCSHAHSDHIRGLLALHRAFPHIPIFGSDVTTRLLPLNWPGQEDSHFCRPLPWRSKVDLAPGLSVQLWPAGHLPGAASFLISYKTSQRTYSVFYGGDCFLSNGRLVDGMPLAELRNLKPDVLIIEGSYGIERHPHRKQQENYLVERLWEALSHGGRAVFPCPLLGLGQELIMLARSHHHFTGQPLDVWVDPVIGAGCDAYLRCLPSLPTAVRNFAQHQALFWDERVLPRVRRLGPDILPSALAQSADPAIFIVHPATPPGAFAHAADWTVMVPALEDISLWQGQLLGRAEGFDWLSALRAASQMGQVEIEHYMLTSHCDGGGTTQLIHNLRPQHVIFVHGQPRQLTDLASLEDLQSRYQLHLPTAAQTIDLPLAEAFWQPPPPQAVHFEGEVAVTAQSITLTLPVTLEEDPRWAQLADTGIVEASWQGDQLVIRGVNQRELLQAIPREPTAIGKTCYYCRHLRGQRCRNPQSPLVGLQVASDASCEGFERSSAGFGLPFDEAV